MSKIKVLKNFKCNGVRGQVGNFLSKEDRDLIGEKNGKDLMNKDFIMMEANEKNDEAPKKEVKKSSKKIK